MRMFYLILFLTIFASCLSIKRIKQQKQLLNIKNFWKKEKICCGIYFKEDKNSRDSFAYVMIKKNTLQGLTSSQVLFYLGEPDYKSSVKENGDTTLYFTYFTVAQEVDTAKCKCLITTRSFDISFDKNYKYIDCRVIEE